MDVAGLDKMHWANLLRSVYAAAAAPTFQVIVLVGLHSLSVQKSTGEALQSLREAAIPDKGASRQQ